MTNGSLMKVENIAEFSPLSIMQYFWPAFRDNWSWKPIFGLFESGILLNIYCMLMFRILFNRQHIFLMYQKLDYFISIFFRKC